jgi:transcription initiation factor TFIIH subunit 4
MDLGGYIEALPAAKREGLYESQWTCQALLRSLPAVAQQYVLRLLFLDEPFDCALVGSWARPEHRGAHEAALARLAGLTVLTTARSAATGKEGYALHAAFKRQLRAALTGAGGRRGAGDAVPPGVAALTPAAAELEAYARAQWEGLLLFLLDQSGTAAPPGLPAVVPCKPLELLSLLHGARPMYSRSSAHSWW